MSDATGAVDPQVRQDVADVLVRYATGIDRRDWDLFRTCFTEDCEADYGDELVDTPEGWRIARRTFTLVCQEPVTGP